VFNVQKTTTSLAIILNHFLKLFFDQSCCVKPSVFESARSPDFSSLPIIIEDWIKDSGGTYSASEPDGMHVIIDRHLITGQNDTSTLSAVQNLILLCNARQGKAKS